MMPNGMPPVEPDMGVAPSLPPIEPGGGEESTSERTVVHYYFPVQIEVLPAPEPPLDPDELVNRALERLAARLESL